MWRRDVAVLCCTCAVGLAVAAALVKAIRSAQLQNDERKPQRRFKKVLADNSHSRFTHLLKEGAEDDMHPFADEIQALVDSPVVSISETVASSEMSESFVWIETPEELQRLAEVLSRETEFAVDTEQHSTRSFLGFIALVQISTYTTDYLVDAIALHDHMDVLRPVFANSSICKIFHGADSDILWLQRDFHIYVVNVFDTARACDVLGKPQRSLAYLLKTYCNVSTNKVFQRSDWRQRPLPEEMLLYARTDAHYLLFIAKKLYAELLQGVSDVRKAPLLEQAMRRSHLICSQLYEKDGVGSSPAILAASLISKYQLSGYEETLQEASLRRRLRLLCEWRDTLARSEDESLRFVLSDAALVDLARACPLTPKEVTAAIVAADRSSSETLPSPSPVIRKHMKPLIHLLKSNRSFLASQSERVCGTGRGREATDPKHKSDVKRKQFVKKFSCKGLVYENCRIYAGDGRLLCFCDRKKLEWYLQRGLAESLSEEPPAIRLRFEPKGRPEDENNEFYIQSKTNQCVGCGESSHYLRYRIIPSCYRQHFPEYMKSHRSHDIVLLCVDCHEKAHRGAEKYKHVVSAEFGVPLFAQKIINSGDDEGEAVESEAGVPPLQLRNTAMALICHGPDMPEERRRELELVISTYFGGREIDEDDIKGAALVGIDPRGQKRLSRKIDKVLKKRKPPPEARDDGGEWNKAESKNSSRIMLLGHGLHGKKVVEQVWEAQGEDGIRDFIQRWRLVFVDAVQPRFLPTGWEVTHSGRREFGEHSVYKPKECDVGEEVSK